MRATTLANACSISANELPGLLKLYGHLIGVVEDAQMKVLTLAAQEVAVGLRNHWVLATTVLMAVLALPRLLAVAAFRRRAL